MLLEAPAFALAVLALNLKCATQANALNAWPSSGAALVGGCGAFRKWGLHGRSRPLRVGLKRLQTGPGSGHSIRCFIIYGMKNLISSLSNGLTFPPRLQTGADPLKLWLLFQALSVRCRSHQGPAPPRFSFCVKKKNPLQVLYYQCPC